METLNLSQLSKEILAAREFAARAQENVSIAEDAFQKAALQAIAEAAGYKSIADAQEAMYFEGTVQTRRGYGDSAKIHNVTIIFAPRVSAKMSNHNGGFYMWLTSDNAESKGGRYVSLPSDWKTTQLPASVQDAYARVKAACETVQASLDNKA